jgi:hypothetical protein
LKLQKTCELNIPDIDGPSIHSLKKQVAREKDETLKPS